MKKIEEIEQNIEKLSKSELKSFRQWFVEYDAEAWDGQFQADAKAGNFADEAIKEYRAGKTSEL